MAIRRPFAGKNLERKEPLDENRGTLQPTNPPRLPLPTPRLQPQARPSEMKRQEKNETRAGLETGVSIHRLDRAKKVFENAGLDPSILDKLVERSLSIDKEVEKIDLEMEKLQRKKAELLEEKQRIARIINALASA